MEDNLKKMNQLPQNQPLRETLMPFGKKEETPSRDTLMPFGKKEETKEFHEMLKLVLQMVLDYYGKKAAPQIYHNIIKPCKRLMQKCSLRSISDTSCLCSLAYWLYFEGNKELALKICEVAHNVDFTFEYWCGIQYIYGLEIRIARELLGENRRNHIPANLLDYYFSKQIKKKIRYPQILREKEIAECDSRCLEIELISALYCMIGIGETGLYHELNENWNEIEQAIVDYIDCLK